jgi:argininosuccinate lyase
MPTPPDELRAIFWRALADAAAAHATMLRDASIVDDDALDALLSAIDNARGGTPPVLSLVLLAGKLDDRIDAGTPAGATGAAQLGRGQMDLTLTAMRLVARAKLRESLRLLNTLSIEVEGFAGMHAVTLMPLYANGVAIQASTLGHMASAFVGALERGREGLITAYRRINRSPLGAAALTGTGLPIERERIANLLGFSGVIEQSFDAVAGNDDLIASGHAIETIAGAIVRWLEELLAIARTDPSAIALDQSWQLTDWAAPQWDAAAGISALAIHGRRVVAGARMLSSLAGDVPWGSIAAETGTLLGTVDDATTGLDVLLERTTALMRDVLVINRAALANRAGRAFVTAADLSDFLIIEESIEPAPARAIAGIVLNRARDAGLEISGITPEMIDTAALMIIGREIKVEFEAISRYLAPRRFIERRNFTGGPAPSAVRSWLAAAEARRVAEMAEFETALPAATS